VQHRIALSLAGLAAAILFGLFGLQVGPSPIAVTNAAVNPSGYVDFSFYEPSISGSNTSADQVMTPTGEKPQSKLWYNDGLWWADMYSRAAHNHHIYKLNWPSTWVDTGTVLDTRVRTKSDCLWDGTHLYVVAGGGGPSNPVGNSTGADLPALLYRYSYNAATKQYTLDPKFPVTVRPGGAETIVIAKDKTGMLWVTYTQNSHVYVNHSLATDDSWAAPFVIPAAGVNTAVAPDDISSLIAYDGKIGVLWGNQTDGTYYFAYHADGAPASSWAGQAAWHDNLNPNGFADDHINLKSLQSDPSGNIYAAVKTSFTASNLPRILLLIGKKQPNGALSWRYVTYSNGNLSQSRPMVLIDTSHRALYMFAATEGGGKIWYKSTSLDNINFGNPATDPGQVFIENPSPYTALDNPTSTKQNVGYQSGLVVLASYDNEYQPSSSPATTDFYLHNVVDLTDPALGPTVTPSATSAPSATATATNTPTPRASGTPTPTPTRGPANAPGSVYLPLVQR
jgi:hypothetical protein